MNALGSDRDRNLLQFVRTFIDHVVSPTKLANESQIRLVRVQYT